MERESQDPVSSSLEDYLESIFQLIEERGIARVREIARLRGVRAASVTPALKRLAALGFIDYVERESIRLTPSGEERARRVVARHQVLHEFLRGVLGVSGSVADSDACSMEHSLSNETMNRLVRFLEYLRVCPHGAEFLQHFRGCGHTQALTAGCESNCTLPVTQLSKSPVMNAPPLSLASLPTETLARVSMVRGEGALRQRLLDLGLLPGAEIRVLRRAPASGPLWVQLRGSQLSLRRQEAEEVVVTVSVTP